MNKCFFCILLIFNYLETQSQTTYQKTYWTRFYARVKLNDKWSWQTEADNRRFFGQNQQLQFIAHTHLHRKLTQNTEGVLGFTFSEVWQGNLAVPEFRPFQEFYFFTKINDKWRFSQRFRTEQRWFRDVRGATLASSFNFKFRARYMPRLEYRLSEKWIAKANAEIMFHHDDFDQYRYYGAFEYKFLPDLSLEIGYLKVFQKRNNNMGFFDRDNLRVTIFKDFVWRKRKER